MTPSSVCVVLWFHLVGQLTRYHLSHHVHPHPHIMESLGGEKPFQGLDVVPWVSVIDVSLRYIYRLEPKHYASIHPRDILSPSPLQLSWLSVSKPLTCLVFYLATASSNQPDTAGQSGLVWSWSILYEDDLYIIGAVCLSVTKVIILPNETF